MNYPMLFAAALGFQAGALFTYLLVRQYLFSELNALRCEQVCIDAELRTLGEEIRALQDRAEEEDAP